MSNRKIEQEIKEEKIARKKEKQEGLYKEYCEMHNKKPVTRRDFLSAGVISFGASMTLPPITTMLGANIAMAQDGGSACPSGDTGSNRMAAFVAINLAGGAMLASNIVPMDAGGQLLSTYNQLGLGNNQLPITRVGSTNTPMYTNSGFLAGLNAVAQPTTLANTAFIGVCTRSRDDSRANKYDATGMVASAGLVGSDLPNMGTRSSSTGIGQDFAQVRPPNPLIVGNHNDIAGAMGVAGALGALDQQQQVSIFNLIKNLSDSQVRKVMTSSGGDMLANLIQCATGKNVELAGKDTGGVDVRANAALSTIWGVNANSGNGDDNVVFGSMALAALTGAAGTVGIDMGGYDYHNNTRTRGDQADNDTGQVVARVLESAAALNQRVFIFVTTDGSCRAPVTEDRDAVWTSDRGSAGMTFMIAYDPAAPVATTGNQLGQFTEGQAADDQFITGGNPELAAAAVFANFAQFNGRPELIERVIPGVFNSGQLQQIIKFA